jgi:uncharacterized protein
VNEPSTLGTLKAGYAAFNDRDADRLRELMVDDFSWNEAEEVPGRKACVSAEEFLAYMMGFEQLWDEFMFEPIGLEQISDETVLAQVVGRGRGKAGGDPVELEISHVWRFREGKVARMDAFLDPADAADAARQPPPGPPPA